MGLEQNLLLTDLLKCMIHLKRRLKQSPRPLRELINGQRIFYVEQEEFRQYDLTKRQTSIARDYLEALSITGVAVEISQEMYYISQICYGKAFFASLYQKDEILQMLGESKVMGKMVKDIEDCIKEKLHGSLREKAKPGMVNMGLFQEE